MIKPRIRKDIWNPGGWICRTSEKGGRVFTFCAVVTGTGKTPEEAYAHWRGRATLMRLQEEALTNLANC